MRKKLVLAGSAILIVLVLLAIGSKLLTKAQENGADKVSDTFINAVLSDRPDDAYKLFSNQAQNAYSSAALGAQANNLTTFFYGKQPSRTSTSERNNNTATVDYDINGSDGAYIITVNLVKQTGNWKVQSFTSTLQPVR